MTPSGTGAFGNAPTPPPPAMAEDSGMASMSDGGAGMSGGGSGGDAGGGSGGGGGGDGAGSGASGVGGDVTVCTDGSKNGNETDVDCGGKDCPKCAGMLTCVVASDCESNVCSAAKRCCAPKTVASCTGTQCGPIADGCGGTITCPNNCPGGGSCSGGTCCTPRTTQSCGANECGAVANGCGGTISCPNNCAGDEICSGGTCKWVCNFSTVGNCPDCGIGNLIYQKCCQSETECGCEWTVFGGCS